MELFITLLNLPFIVLPDSLHITNENLLLVSSLLCEIAGGGGTPETVWFYIIVHREKPREGILKYCNIIFRPVICIGEVYLFVVKQTTEKDAE